ncbi:elongation factor EF-2 [Candidatus Woesearchaeota archaeon]|nr:elongation factor EF-2 [Candidatus Woesearchaeota archaeon]
MIEKIKELMKNPERIRNIDIAAHIDHGKTTLSDNLLAGAGMLSQELAGKALSLDFHEDEQQRGITIDAAAVSMVHNYEGEDYLINLIDTPGHVDFGGDVTRAMRAVDGTIIVVCAVEGIMPQTETVVKQALREYVKPILFINKVDRLIKELQLPPEKMQERFMKIIMNVNKFIEQNAPKEFKEKWQVDVNNGTVIFGSAFHNWALSIPYMKKKGITFKDIIEAYQQEGERWKELKKKAPLHEVLLDAVIKHLPNPREAQKYRIPNIWQGDLESPIGKALLNADPNGEPAFIITKMVVDPQAGELAIGRLFSGTLRKGMQIYLNRAKQQQRVQQLYVAEGAKRQLIDEAPAGNIIGIAGLKNAYPGETISVNPITPFEQMKHIFDPVITKAIEATKPSDLPKLVDVLIQVQKEDPNIVVEINQETGEHLISGMGELHLEVIEERIRREKGVDVKTSPPIVVYRETVTSRTPEPVEGKSPNKHNKFYIRVEPLPDSIYEAIHRMPDMRIKKNMPEIWEKLEAAGMDKQETRRVKAIYKGNIFVDNTRGIVHIGEVIELILDMFEEVMSNGPLAREPCIKVKVILEDVVLHEDAIHRGPSQVYPAVRTAIRKAMMLSKPVILEPVQTLLFEAPLDYMGAITKLVSSKRGQLLEMNQDEHNAEIKAKIPVAEMFGLSSELRSATGGRGTFFLVDQEYQKLPEEMQQKIIEQIRQRKGLKAFREEWSEE